MKQARADSLLSTESGISRKVYDAIPISEPWNLKQIISELHRKGVTANQRTIEGCIASLEGRGLVKRLGQKNSYTVMRVKVTQPTTPTKKEPVEMPTTQIAPDTPEPAANELTPLEKISELSAQMHDLARTAISMAKVMEEVACEVDDMINSKNEEHDKLVQLKTLLKELA